MTNNFEEGEEERIFFFSFFFLTMNAIRKVRIKTSGEKKAVSLDDVKRN
jgi:ribosome biogenesis protein Nip4